MLASAALPHAGGAYAFDAEKDSAIDLTRIQTIVIYANPGADAFTGVIHFDELESTDQKN